MTLPAALIAVPYPGSFEHFARGRVGDLLSADLRLMLATSSYPLAAGDQWLAATQGFEAAGAGYPAGGMALANQSVAVDPGTGRASLMCDPVVFAAAGFIARHAVIYLATGDPGTSPLLSHADFGADLDPAGGAFTAAFPSGVIRLGPVS